MVAIGAVDVSACSVGVAVTAGRAVLRTAVKALVKSSAVNPYVDMIKFSQMVRLQRGVERKYSRKIVCDSIFKILKKITPMRSKWWSNCSLIGTSDVKERK